jgi:flagellar assembly protein FliH
MSDHAKFDFSTVFTPGTPHPDDNPHALLDPADVPVYSQKQLDAALAEARNEGAVVASDEASQNADAVANQILASIEQHFARLGTFQDSVVTSIHADAVELALVVGQKLARSLLSREPQAEIEALILEMLQQHSEIGSTPKIMIRVHPVVAPNVTTRIEMLKNNVAFTGEVSVLPVEGFGPTDCSVEWAEGGAVRNLKLLEEEVTATIKKYLSAIGAPNTASDIPSDEAPEAVPIGEVAEEMPPAPVEQQSSVIDEVTAEAQLAAAAPENGS